MQQQTCVIGLHILTALYYSDSEVGERMEATRSFLTHTHSKTGVLLGIFPKTEENYWESVISGESYNPMKQQTGVMGLHILTALCELLTVRFVCT
jgi:hypothetical protein